MNNKTEFQIKRSNNFTIVNNQILRDKNLSLKSIGLLCKMISLPPNWDYSFNGLVSICKESYSAIRTAINELKNAGYIEIIKQKDNKGLFTYKYIVYDLPKSLYLSQNNPTCDFPPMDSPTLENQQQLNTNIINTNKLIDKIDKTSHSDEYSIFTKELIKNGYVNSNEYNLNYYNNLFSDYLNRGYTREQLFMSIHYIVNKVKSNKFKDEDGNEIVNKYGYFKSALDLNFKKFENDSPLYDDDYDWLNDDKYWNDNLKTFNNMKKDDLER